MPPATGIVNGLTSTELGASYILPRLIGAAHSTDLLLTGRTVDAAGAKALGLVVWLNPTFDTIAGRIGEKGKLDRPLFADELEARSLYRSRLPSFRFRFHSQIGQFRRRRSQSRPLCCLGS